MVSQEADPLAVQSQEEPEKMEDCTPEEVSFTAPSNIIEDKKIIEDVPFEVKKDPTKMDAIMPKVIQQNTTVQMYDIVRTKFGEGVVLESDESITKIQYDHGICFVASQNIEPIAEGLESPNAHKLKSNMRDAFVQNRFPVGSAVQTEYGEGEVLSVNKTLMEVEVQIGSKGVIFSNPWETSITPIPHRRIVHAPMTMCRFSLKDVASLKLILGFFDVATALDLAAALPKHSKEICIEYLRETGVSPYIGMNYRSCASNSGVFGNFFNTSWGDQMFASADSIVKPELALMQNLAQLGVLTNLPSRAISLEQYAPKDLGGDEVPEEVQSDEEELEDKIVPPEFQEDIRNSEKSLEKGSPAGAEAVKDVDLGSEEIKSTPVVEKKAEDLTQAEVVLKKDPAEIVKKIDVMKVKDDPMYAKYFKMLKMQIPKPTVLNKMKLAGVDSTVIDLDPEAPSPNSQTQDKMASVGGDSMPLDVGLAKTGAKDATASVKEIPIIAQPPTGPPMPPLSVLPSGPPKAPAGPPLGPPKALAGPPLGAPKPPSMPPKSKYMKKKKKKKQNPKNAKDAQFKKAWSAGVGFGSSVTGDIKRWDVRSYVRQAKAAEREVQKIFLEISKHLGSTAFANEFVQESCVIPALLHYCQNDSFSDISQKHELYTGVFSVLLKILENPVYGMPLLFEEHQTILAKCICKLGLQAESVVAVEAKAKSSDRDKVDPLSDLAKLIKQTLDTLRKHVDSFISIIQISQMMVKDSQSGDELYDKMLALREQMEQGFQEPVSVSMDASNEDYEAVMRQMVFDSCDTMKDFGPHKYSKNTSNMKRKLMKRLAAEYADLPSSLPIHYDSCILFRFCEEQMSHAQMLIIPPYETPYGGGCFIFDVFFPDRYPSVPPKVNLATTGGGSVRFNPNLYNSGKVCLSILGTWSAGSQGEGWNAGLSTFLQVAISIQSLVFVPEPYYNEPGYERMMGTKKGNDNSRNYNDVIQKGTTAWAMIDLLKNPPALWKDVIQAHFRMQGERALQNVKTWLGENHGQTKKLTELLEELRST